jgi:hypothetical protein
VFRPEELTSTDESHRFYDAVRQAGSGVGLRAKWRLGGRSLVYVEESGSGGGLYCSVATDVERWPIRRVKSRLVWVGVRAYVRFLGQSPFLASTKLTGSNRSDRPVAGA